MIRVALGLSVVMWLVGGQAQAGGFRDCDPFEAREIARSLDAAKNLTVTAAAAVGATDEYERWFGDFSVGNAEKVRAGLKGIVTAIRRGAVTVHCEEIAPDGCGPREYAFVFSDRPYHLHLCPSFFGLPSLGALRPGTRRSDFGTREGTIIHEMSHFLHVAGTEDHCYSRRECASMARRAPQLAIDNADSFQYFAEDVTYFGRLPLSGKPPPAPRPTR